MKYSERWCKILSISPSFSMELCLPKLFQAFFGFVCRVYSDNNVYLSLFIGRLSKTKSIWRWE